MLLITALAAVLSAPIGPLMQSRRWKVAGLLYLFGFAFALFGLVGPLGGLPARDAALGGYLIGLVVSAISLSIWRLVDGQERDRENPASYPPID